MTAHAERYEALRTLLALPDPPELLGCTAPVGRGRRYLCAGDPTQRERLKREFERAYIRFRHLDAGHQESAIVSVRRSPMRIVRRRTA